MKTDLPWPERENDLRRKGFTETEIAKARSKAFPRRKRAKAGHLTEYEEQKALVKWFRSEYPEHRRRLIAILNDAHRGSLVRASVDKARGLVPGTSDLFLRVPVGSWHGLWIEMKTAIGRASDEETQFLSDALRDGYAGAVCRGSKAAQEIIAQYLRDEHGTPSH
jgi:hypothetical protein